jgi:hypothetical protein
MGGWKSKDVMMYLHWKLVANPVFLLQMKQRLEDFFFCFTGGRRLAPGDITRSRLVDVF